MYNYFIKYEAYNKAGQLIKQGKVKAKRKYDSFQAKVEFEKHLQKSLPGFHRLVVLSCNVETFLGEMPEGFPPFDELAKIFGGRGKV